MILLSILRKKHIAKMEDKTNEVLQSQRYLRKENTY